MDRVSDGDRTAGSEALSPWTATGLEPNPEYSVAIYTYSAAGDEYSAEPAEATFATAGADAANAEKHAPKRVRRMRAARAQGEGASDDSAVLAWNPPSTKNGKHHAATDCAVMVVRLAENGDRTEVATTDEIAAREFTVEGLTTDPPAFCGAGDARATKAVTRVQQGRGSTETRDVARLLDEERVRRPLAPMRPVR
ncbi:MAG: hypothetical protein OXE53_08630 [Deltaproteobacteria bacterium]|nr:hypothetical protein [Deltaproteobacteria bacterium]